ncbi:response regulator, partial [Cytophagia bacterium CHB2]|nr:response regulator [Cytophagia bacterium CHB2]
MSDERDKILLVDDEPEGVFGLETLLGDTYQLFTAATGEQAWAILQEEDIAVALVDLTLADLDGLQLLQRMQKKLLGTELIMVTGYASIDTAVDAMRLGAYD